MGSDAARGGIFAEAANYDLNVDNGPFAATVAHGGTGLLADGGNAAGGSPYLQNGGRGNAHLVNDTTALIVANDGSRQGALGKPRSEARGRTF